jgi:hypothetical protein
MNEPVPLALLEHTIDYVYGESQKRARTRQDHEDFAITLRLLGLLCDGWTAPDLFSLACSYAVGLTHKKYLRRRAERAEFERLELLRCIPDYDWSREPRIADDPTNGRRHFGNQYASHGMNTLAIKEAAARLGMTNHAIYTRLRNGWSWEEATSQTRQPPGRKHYGNRFRNLATQRISEDESIPSRNPHEDVQAAGERFGDRPTAYDRHSASSRARATDFTAGPVTDRRGAPKRLSSPAQARLEARFRAAQREVYFGA